MGGRAFTSPASRYAATVSSLPLIPCSTSTEGPSENANFTAETRSSGRETLDTPKLDPPCVGFTNTGKLSFAAASAANFSRSMPSRTKASGAIRTQSKPLR